MDLRLLRNVGVFAHIDAGKTTLTERILLATGRERRAGRVDDGTTVMDWMPEERERGITITAAATRVRWLGVELNLIDTPGHVDFTYEVERSLRALDGAVLVIDAVVGVQAQTETIWRQLERAAIPTVVFVNKCDRPGADALAAAGTLRARFGLVPVPIAYPWFDGEGHLVGLVDVLALAAFSFAADGTPTRHAVPEALAVEVGVLRAELVDALASRDEALLEVVGAGATPTVADLQLALRRRTLAREVVPVVVGAALRGVGVQHVLDAILAYLPSPLDVPPQWAFPLPSAEPGAALALAPGVASGAAAVAAAGAAAPTLPVPPPEPDAPLVAFAFKVQTTRHDDLVFVRLVSGRVAPRQRLWNPRLGAHERVATVLRLHANAFDALEIAEAGDIVALTGLARTTTGDTLVTREDGALGFAGTLAPLRTVEPVLTLTVEPADATEREKLGVALGRLAREDPSFRAVEDPVSGQWTAQGMGELHLEVTLGRLGREFGLAPRIGRPQVAFREVLTGRAEGHGVLERALGGKEGFAEVAVRVRPGPLTAATFAPNAAVPEARRAAVAAALCAEATVGPRFGLPLLGVAIEVHGGRARREADVEAVWVQAAVAALREALRTAAQSGGVAVHEPHAALVVETPEAFSSSVIGDLQSRRAAVGEVESTHGARRIHAEAPLAELFGYTTALRSLSQGRAVCTLVPVGHGPVPEGELALRGLA